MRQHPVFQLILSEPDAVLYQLTEEFADSTGFYTTRVWYWPVYPRAQRAAIVQFEI